MSGVLEFEASSLHPEGWPWEAPTGPGGPEEPDTVVLPGIDRDPRKYLTRGIRKRRSNKIMGYVGLNGDGKTFSMIRDTLPDLAAGRRVLSTVALLDPSTGNPHPLYVPFRHWAQLDDWRDGPVCMDEVTGVMDSRDSGLPKKVRKKIPQMRRAGAPMRWTGIDWDNSDRRMRQLTKAMVLCRGYLPKKPRGVPFDELPMWLPNRLFMLTTFDASKMTTSEDSRQLTQDEEKKKKARVMNRELVWGPGSLAFQVYDTLDAVDSIDNTCGELLEDGTVCGGRIPEKVCKGHGDRRASGGSRDRPASFH